MRNFFPVHVSDTVKYTVKVSGFQKKIVNFYRQQKTLESIEFKGLCTTLE